jgi:hypothetical protein
VNPEAKATAPEGIAIMLSLHGAFPSMAIMFMPFTLIS